MHARIQSLLAKTAYGLSIIALGAISANASTAQSHDPVPVRVGLQSYGGLSGNGNDAVRVDIDASGADASAIVVSGSRPGHFGVLLLGAERINSPGIFNTSFLVRPLAVLALGFFDQDGSARIPVDLVQRAPSVVHIQALSVSAKLDSANMSAGLSVRFARGNEQTQLSYKGPKSTAILIARADERGTSHDVLHRVAVPTSGWTLRESSRSQDGAVTRIFMELEESKPALQILETKRHLIRLGDNAKPQIEIWIRQTEKGKIEPAPFELAARIERAF